MRPTCRFPGSSRRCGGVSSRLMGADEEGTPERLKALRRELLDRKITEHRGHRFTFGSPSPDYLISWMWAAFAAVSSLD
jgi:hypothetical protein